MPISSRTPDGQFNHCPVCGREICITPSEPAGDAPCPNCGVLLWFVETVYGFAYFDRSDFQLAVAGLENSSCEVSFFDFTIGSRVRITSGMFQSMEGTIQNIDFVDFGKATVIVSIFGRDTPVDVEIRQLEAV